MPLAETRDSRYVTDRDVTTIDHLLLTAQALDLALTSRAAAITRAANLKENTEWLLAP